MGNLHSVSRAIATVGGNAAVTREPDDVAGADALVIPGVGAFGACVRALTDRGLDRAIHDFVGTGRPVFGVCLGMQVLFKESDEDPEEGLSIVPGRSRKLPPDVKVPHMGWNTVDWSGSAPLRRRDPQRHPVLLRPLLRARRDRGNDRRASPTTAARSPPWSPSDNVFATQFHPEKSADAGLQIYASFVKAVSAA